MILTRFSASPDRPSAPRAARPRVEALEGRLALSTLPPGFLETSLATGLSSPSGAAVAPDGRLFAIEQGGSVKLVRGDGSTWTALHLNVDSAGERGLLGIAFDPAYATNHFAYLYYTNPDPGGAPWAAGEHNQLSRFTVNDANPSQPQFTNEAPILDWDSLGAATNHNGGAIHFGPDGMLYAVAGDNTQTFVQGGHTYRVSQTLADLLGKQLRINVAAFNAGTAVRDDARVGQLIPPDNPFVGVAAGINQLIYALGLRNPFSFAVQPGTGTIFANDVGENTWEEIDQIFAGANYGWSGGDTDGFGQTPPGPGTYHDPLLAYSHNGGPAGGGLAIVTGAFYDPATLTFPAAYQGKYFYGDLSGWIRVFDPGRHGTPGNPDTSTAFATNIPGGLRALAVEPTGSLVYLAGDGSVWRVSYPPPPSPPQLVTQPTSQAVDQNQAATFRVEAKGGSLTYAWQHLVGQAWTVIGFGPVYTIAGAQAADAGSYRVTVVNNAGSVTSDVVTLTVNQLPTTAIVSPAGGARYNWGQAITLSGQATDPEDGALPASHLTWLVYFVGTDSPGGAGPRVRQVARLDGTATGAFVPAVYDTTPFQFYRVYLLAYDSRGAVSVAQADVVPNTVRLTLWGYPFSAGIPVALDGRFVAGGTTVTSVVGLPHSLAAVSPLTWDGHDYAFVAWNDGGAAIHSAATPAADAVYAAVYATPGGPAAARPAVIRGRIPQGLDAGPTRSARRR
jgi:glucose/arabinose dehydrogenase